ncbi:LysM peptidoglycan-binding domain-containing protein [Schinkia azotoformans]|uniref:NLP/P60 protein n=1 Tax=Schinkia azotoformans LMG 9581 TaxID=1131731 RepID=K6DL67_SCHAZ|nr:C40 family peptidase [Schinkia azotoformans]EKN68913.1 NLP/P60 protein [Schinkia azotoformans LMG 9581]MEC1641010.1 LysM peptidoglycan-binding domain-containing protein [Schinkia azotoformans]MEC1720107.1 LysM peptidoglycan-binding domain-containing protein [Schinkia azotoformans]MEC1944099.1 LysM peptidoglycan-binding domain-containing protein [Schinkia azotoformans]MED4354266.1 LysM peptidoglycan-binding domain-containing protein [Schinkia azotoformans]
MKKFIITAGLAGTLLFASQADAATYTVKSGDVLWKIAYDNNTSASQIIEWNGLTSAMIYPGQVLKVSQDLTNSKYTVKAGDTIYIISQKYNTTITAILAINAQITNPNNLYIGQVINVPSTSQTVPVQETTGQDIINSGKKYIGAGYLYGASTTRADVFDCSSFIKRVYEEHGIYLPRTSQEQANAGTSVPFSQARVGDIVSYDTNFDGTIDHAGLFVDPNTILHSSSSKGVDYSNTTYYWKDRMVKVTRIIK